MAGVNDSEAATLIGHSGLRLANPAGCILACHLLQSKMKSQEAQKPIDWPQSAGAKTSVSPSPPSDDAPETTLSKELRGTKNWPLPQLPSCTSSSSFRALSLGEPGPTALHLDPAPPEDHVAAGKCLHAVLRMALKTWLRSQLAFQAHLLLLEAPPLLLHLCQHIELCMTHMLHMFGHIIQCSGRPERTHA